MRVTSALEQPAREDPDLEVGRLQPPSAPGTRPGLTVTNSKRPSSVAASGRSRGTRPRAGSRGRRPGGRSGRRVRLPDLDHPVRDRLARAVEERAVQIADRPRVGRVDEPRAIGPRAGRSRRYGPTVCEGVRPRAQSSCGSSSGVAVAAAEHDVPAGSRAPSRARSARGRSCRSAARAPPRRGSS